MQTRRLIRLFWKGALNAQQLRQPIVYGHVEDRHLNARKPFFHICATVKLTCLLLLFALNSDAVESVQLGKMTGGQAESINEDLEVVLGKKGGFSILDRAERARNLYTKTISDADAEALFSAIVLTPKHGDVRLEHWAVLFNDVLNVLNQQQSVLSGFTSGLLAIIGDTERPAVMRDYALQHILSCVEYKLDVDAQEKTLALVNQLVWQAPSTSLPGTYLLGVYQQAGKPGYPEVGDLGVLALEIATDVDAYMPNRITAIQVCGQLNYNDALPLALEVAADKAADLGFRTASIATIANLDGVQQAKEILQEIQKRGHPRLRYAAKSALK